MTCLIYLKIGMWQFLHADLLKVGNSSVTHGPVDHVSFQVDSTVAYFWVPNSYHYRG